jgi:hypothetical protein
MISPVTQVPAGTVVVPFGCLPGVGRNRSKEAPGQAPFTSCRRSLRRLSGREGGSHE